MTWVLTKRIGSLLGPKVKYQTKQVISGSDEKKLLQYNIQGQSQVDYEYKDLEGGEINMCWKYWGMT